MTVEITSVSPRRMFGVDDPAITIDGTGFGTAGNNTVLVSGSPGTIVFDNPTQVQFRLPFLFTLPLIVGVHVLCQLVNDTTGESAYFWIRVKLASAEDVADRVLDSAVPGPFEVTGAEQDAKRFFEARDMERLCSLIESFSRDVAAGQVLAWDGAAGALAEPAGNDGGGQVLLVDAAEATDLRWSHQQDAILPFGGAVSGASVLLVAGGTQTDTAGAGETEGWAPIGGTIDRVWLLVKEPGGNTLDRVRILVNSIAVFDSGAGLALGNNSVYTANPALAVSAGDIVELEASRAGAGTINLVGGLRALLD